MFTELWWKTALHCLIVAGLRLLFPASNSHYFNNFYFIFFSTFGAPVTPVIALGPSMLFSLAAFSLVPGLSPVACPAARAAGTSSVLQHLGNPLG